MSLDCDTAVRLLISGRSSLLGYIHAIVRDWSLADDVFQEVSILTLRKCDSIRDAAHFGAWVRSAARLEAMNLLRKRNRGPSPLGNTVLDLLDGAWDADEAEMPSDHLELLRICIEKLTDRARRLLHLRYTQGIKGAALASFLQQQPNTVYVALSRIHRQLENCVQQGVADRARREDAP